jgi:hypothetical protein
MIELLSHGSREGWDRLRSAVEEALSLGCQDVAAIRHLLLMITNKRWQLSFAKLLPRSFPGSGYAINTTAIRHS